MLLWWVGCASGLLVSLHGTVLSELPDKSWSSSIAVPISHLPPLALLNVSSLAGWVACRLSPPSDPTAIPALFLHGSSGRPVACQAHGGEGGLLRVSWSPPHGTVASLADLHSRVRNERLNPSPPPPSSGGGSFFARYWWLLAVVPMLLMLAK